MLISIIIITTMMLSVSVFVLYVYRQDLQNRKNTFVTLAITMVGTFSGVLLAFTATEYQTELRERRELGTIIDQAEAEANNASYYLSTSLAGFSHSITKAPATNPTDDEIKKYKDWLTNEPQSHSELIKSIDSFSTSSLFDKLPYIDTLYLNPYYPRYVSHLSQPLGYFIRYGETLRSTIRTLSASPAERLQAINDYFKNLNKICKILELSKKYLRNTLTDNEMKIVKKMAGQYNILAEPRYGP